MYVYIATIGLLAYGFNVIFTVMLNSLGWSRGNTSLAISISGMLTGFVLTPAEAVIINKIGSRKSIIMGLFITKGIRS